MGTISEKLTYLNGTKQLLKDKINNLGGSIDEQTTFREYVDQLDGVYDTLPKTSFQEGTEVTIENGLKGKLDFEDGIVGIGDTSQKSYQGYQMIRQASFGTFTNNGVTFTQRADGSILVNGTTTSNGASINLLTGDATVVNNDNNIAILPNQAYTLSGANDPIRVVLHTSSYSYVKNANTTFTETGNVSMSALRIIVPADTTINNVVMYPMLEKGSTAHDYEPYVGGIASPNPSYPQEVEVVRGKNRLPLNEADFTTTFYGQNVEIKDEVIKISGSATQVYSISVGKNGLVTPSDTSRITFKVNSGTYKYTQFNSGTSYSGINVRLKDEDTNTLYTTESTITLSETHTFSINIFVADIDSKNAEIKLQLEKGSQATSYLPYNTLEIVESGKNLLEAKLNTTTNNGITVTNNNDGTFTISGENTSSSVTTFRINQSTQTGVDNLQNYEDGTYTLDKGTDNTNIQITLMQNLTWAQFIATGMDVRFKSQAITGATNTFICIGIKGNANFSTPVTIKPMFIKGSYTSETIPDYEPYHTSITYPISLGKNKFYSIGNYADELLYDVDEDKVYKNEKIGKYTFTGNETGMYYESGGNRFVINDLVNSLEVSGRQQIYSNRYKFIESGSADYGMFTFYNTAHQVFIYHKDYTNPSDLLTYYANNNTYFYYIKNTATLIELTDPTLKQQVKNWYYAKSNTGTTIIESNGDLPMIIKVRALKGE